MIRDKSLSLGEYNDILRFISKNHKFGSLNESSKNIKYIDTTFDFRTNTIFNVELRGLFGKKVFTVVNGGMDEHNSLKEAIMEFLNE